MLRHSEAPYSLVSAHPKACSIAACAAVPITARFVRFPEVEEVTSQGSTRASVRLRGGLQVDLRVVPTGSFGAALAYFTGSKAHNIALRRMAQERGLKLNECGVFRGTKQIAGDTEESVYRAVDLPLIPPELREDRGEIEAAREGRLPKLIQYADLKGDLHAHTDATDGRDTLENMAAAAQAIGLQYVAITDHSRRQTMSHGLDPPRLAQQVAAIDRIRKAKARQVYLEVNAQPERLDLTDTYCRMAKDEGVLLAITSDAHSVRELAHLRYGVGQARRGWISAGDVLNTRSLAQLLPLLHRPAAAKRPKKEELASPPG